MVINTEKCWAGSTPAVARNLLQDSGSQKEMRMEMTKPVVIKRNNGEVEWEQKPGDLYVVTGVLANGQRFKPITTSSWRHANGINLFRGTKWLLRNGKRY